MTNPAPSFETPRHVLSMEFPRDEDGEYWYVAVCKCGQADHVNEVTR